MYQIRRDLSIMFLTSDSEKTNTMTGISQDNSSYDICVLYKAQSDLLMYKVVIVKSQR